MANEYDDNQCIVNQFTDSDCGGVHDIRPGGADGSAGDGIYGGIDGAEEVTLDRINWMRHLPCGKFDMKGLRTLFYFVFKQLDALCSAIANLPVPENVKSSNSNAILGSVSYGAISSNVFPEGNYDSGNTNLSLSVPSSFAGKTKMVVQVELLIRGELNSGQDDMTGYITVSGQTGYGQARIHADATSFDVIGTNAGTFSDTRSVMLIVPVSNPTISYRIFRASSSFIGPANKGAGLYQIFVRPVMAF